MAALNRRLLQMMKYGLDVCQVKSGWVHDGASSRYMATGTFEETS